MSLKEIRMTKPRAIRQPERTHCATWATLLPDAAEGLLSEIEQQAFEQHMAGCAACREEMAEAQRGLAWLELLKDEVPEPPANMLSSILAATTGMAETGAYLPAFAPPAVTIADTQPMAEPALAGAGGIWRWLRGDEGTWSSLLQPRLAMTGAMAFLSICLTVNLLGISIAQLDGQALRKGGIHRTVADTGASLVRSFEGLRVVYRVQSRVSEMRSELETPADLRGRR